MREILSITFRYVTMEISIQNVVQLLVNSLKAAFVIQEFSYRLKFHTNEFKFNTSETRE